MVDSSVTLEFRKLCLCKKKIKKIKKYKQHILEKSDIYFKLSVKQSQGDIIKSRKQMFGSQISLSEII